MPPLLEINNIETYYDLIYAIRGASLHVEAGTITAILGNNGARQVDDFKDRHGPDRGPARQGDDPLRRPAH